MVETAPDAIVITGATATGKTRLAIEVARAVGGEVVSMDSRQVYRGMDIGTAKPDPEERQGVPHHGFDLINPDERYSAGRFARDARKWIGEIRARGRVPILAGGTGFFLRALTRPLFREPVMDSARRVALETWLKGLDSDRLRDWVSTVEGIADLGSWGGGGRQRLSRRLEVAFLTGRTLSWWQTHSPAEEPALRPLVFVLGLDRTELDRRIDERVLRMVDRGLVGEVRRLVEQGYTAADPGMNATGYIELSPHIAGERTLDEAVRLIQIATRRYARRQVTWYRNQLGDEANRLDAALDTIELRDHVLGAWKGAAN